MVARDHAGHRLLIGYRLPDPHRYPIARPKPAPPWRVIYVHRHRAHAPQIAGLERPRKLFQRRSAKATQKDLCDGVALAIVAAIVEVEIEAPWRAGLVVVVADGHHDAQ